MRFTGKPLIYGGVYFLILFGTGVINGVPVADQVVQAAIFSVAPLLALIFIARKKDSTLAWILAISGAVVVNDLLVWMFEGMMNG